MGNVCRDHLAAFRLHRSVDQHLKEQIALCIAAAQQPDLIAPRLEQRNDPRMLRSTTYGPCATRAGK